MLPLTHVGKWNPWRILLSTEDAQIKAVCGLRGYGKSTKVVSLLRDRSRVLYFDSLGDDYTDGVIVSNLKTLERFWRGVYRQRFRIIYRPTDPLHDVGRVCELAYACGDLALVIDEIQLYFRGPWCDPPLTKVITSGRHAGVELIGVTQTPKRLGELLRSQAHEWYIFAVREPQQVKYLADRCVGVDASDIAGLHKYEYLHYVDGAECYWRCMDDPSTGLSRTERIDYASGPVPTTGQHADAG